MVIRKEARGGDLIRISRSGSKLMGRVSEEQIFGIWSSAR